MLHGAGVSTYQTEVFVVKADTNSIHGEYGDYSSITTSMIILTNTILFP